MSQPAGLRIEVDGGAAHEVENDETKSQADELVSAGLLGIVGYCAAEADVPVDDVLFETRILVPKLVRIVWFIVLATWSPQA